VCATGHLAAIARGGAAVFNSPAALTDVTVSNNRALIENSTATVPFARGGGIFIDTLSFLNLKRCNLTNNQAIVRDSVSASPTAVAAAYGGALSSAGPNVNVTSVSFVNNSARANNHARGGAVWIGSASRFTAQGSMTRFDNNRVTSSAPLGGAIYVTSPARLRLWSASIAPFTGTLPSNTLVNTVYREPTASVVQPTVVPSMAPTRMPSLSPTLAPTPVTSAPTARPSISPSAQPTAPPTSATLAPSGNPTVSPTQTPNQLPTSSGPPTAPPTELPTPQFTGNATTVGPPRSPGLVAPGRLDCDAFALYAFANKLLIHCVRFRVHAPSGYCSNPPSYPP
jgi:hypothetical protein